MLEYLILEQEGLLDTRQGRINRLIKNIKKEKDPIVKRQLLLDAGINFSQKELRQIRRETAIDGEFIL